MQNRKGPCWSDFATKNLLNLRNIGFSGAIWSSFLCHSEITESFNFHSSQRRLKRQLYLQNSQINAARFAYRQVYKSWFAVYFPSLSLPSFKESCVKKKQQCDSTWQCALFAFLKNRYRTRRSSISFLWPSPPIWKKEILEKRRQLSLYVQALAIFLWVHCAALILLFSHSLLKIEKEICLQ